MTVRGESMDRIERRIRSLEESAVNGLAGELVIAAPPSEQEALRDCVGRSATSLRVSVVSNPSGERSAGLNAALRAAQSPIIVRVDARSSIRPRHLAEYETILRGDPSVGVTGGRQVPVSESSQVVPRAIARTLGNPWTLGGASYRRRSAVGDADTVYLGAYRRNELLALGGWDERLTANEDYDLCRRYAADGFRVWLADIDVEYEPRETIRAVWRQYQSFGRAKIDYWRLRSEGPRGRQLLALSALWAGLVSAPWVLRRRRRAVLATGMAAAGLAALDSRSTQTDGALVRAVAIALIPLIWVAWVTGLATGAIVG